MPEHTKTGPTSCSCSYVALTPKRLSGHIGGSRGKACGAANGRWNSGQLITSHGYILVRVDKGHHLAFGPPRLVGAYAYEHDLVAEAILGRELRPDETVHHRNGKRADNRPENIEVKTRSDHARKHADFPGARDEAGRFRAGSTRSGDPAEWPEDLRVRELPQELERRGGRAGVSQAEMFPAPAVPFDARLNDDGWRWRCPHCGGSCFGDKTETPETIAVDPACCFCRAEFRGLDFLDWRRLPQAEKDSSRPEPGWRSSVDRSAWS